MSWDESADYSTDVVVPKWNFGKLIAVPGGSGPPGPKGDTGDVGPQGEVGPVGPSGNMATFASLSVFPAAGDSANLYVAEDTGDSYRWDGAKYVRISERVASIGIEDSTVVGRSLVTAVDAKAGRDALSAVGRGDNVFNVRDFGAKGDWNSTAQTGTDDTAAFQAAYAAASASTATNPNGSRIVYIPPGRYRLTGTWVLDQIGTHIVGGPQALLFIDHLNGPGIHLSHRSSTLNGLTVYCSNTRKNAPFDNTNIGVLVSGPDQSGWSLTHTFLRDVQVWNHPSHGIVVAGYGYHSLYERLYANSCKGHGFVFDGGELIGKTNRSSPGIFTVRHCWSALNGGHGLLIGNPASTSTPFRILVDNLESSDNAKDNTVRFTPDDTWIFGDNIEVRRCAFGPVTYDPTRFGVRIAGRSHVISNNRYISVGRSVTLSGDTLAGTSPAGSTVDNPRVIGTQPVGVMIEAGVVNATVRIPLTTNMTVPVEDYAAAAAGNVVVTLPPHSSQTLAAAVNDWKWPLGKKTLRLTGASGGSTITGLAWGSSCRQVRVINVSVANVTLAHQNAGSVAENRLLSSTGADVVLQTNGSALLEYDPGTSRWRITGVEAGATAAVTKDEIVEEETVASNPDEVAQEREFFEEIVAQNEEQAE